MGAESLIILEDVRRLQTLMEIPHTEVNEGWKDVVIGSTLFLSTVLPVTVLSSPDKKPEGDKQTEYIITNRLLTKQEVQDIMHKLFSEGFVPIKDKFSTADIDYISEGKYLIADAEGFDVTNVNTVLDYTMQANSLYYAPRMEKKKTYRLFKKKNERIEGIVIVLFEPYAQFNNPIDTKNNEKRR